MINDFINEVKGSLKKSGGVTSWNDLEDRPFYEMSYIKNTTLIDNLKITKSEMTYSSVFRKYTYNFSESISIFADNNYVLIIDGVEYNSPVYIGSGGATFTNVLIDGWTAKYFRMYNDSFAIETGTDLNADDFEFTISLYEIAENNECHKIDPKFIPSFDKLEGAPCYKRDMTLIDEVILSDCEEIETSATYSGEKWFALPENLNLSFDETKKYKLILDGQVYSTSQTGIHTRDTVGKMIEWATGAGNYVYLTQNDDTTGLIFGPQFEYNLPNKISVLGNPEEEIKRLDEEFMPLLASPNGTKYKITVSNDGTLSAVSVNE